jgi:hypothetical protein
MDKRYERQSINANKSIQLSIKIWSSMLTINILTKILDKRYNANKIYNIKEVKFLFTSFLVHILLTIG